MSGNYGASTSNGILQNGDRRRMRPALHITASCWINDPCAPGYDPKTQLYHLFYQSNPYGCNWGNISWGHITSRDLLTWTHTPNQPALKPGKDFDHEGVFTGCFAPFSDIDGGDYSQLLTVFYSSVCHLPFHWSTPPYPRNAAGLAMATSSDGGRTWTKLLNNPILAGEPANVDVTGFRDPYIASWPAIEQVREVNKPSLYGIISGGIEAVGPTTFMYAVPADRLSHWTYLGTLVDLPARFQPSKKWTGNYGINWECTNFMSLTHQSIERHGLILGAEGDVERSHIARYNLPSNAPVRTVRTQLWMFGDIVKRGDAGNQVRLVYKYGGFLDHGSYYAANSFVDPVSGRRIVYGWIPEDCSLSYARQKGWNGCLAVPRELFLLRIPNVTRGLYCSPSKISCVEMIEQDLYTLGIRPVAELQRLRENCAHMHENRNISLPQDPSGTSHHICSTYTAVWELETTISMQSGCETETVGFHLCLAEDSSIRTTVSFTLRDETITVAREASNSRKDINRCPDQGPFTLFFSAQDGEEILEKLHLRVFLDGDVLEVYANNRFALATMVYFDSDATAHDIYAFATGSVESALFEDVQVWDGLMG